MNVKLKAKQKNIRIKILFIAWHTHTLVASCIREYFTSLLVAVPTNVLEQNFLL